NQRTSKWVNGLGRFQPRELQKHLLRSSQLDRSTLRQEFEQLHQAWPWGGLARIGPTTPKQLGAVTVRKLMVTSKQTRIEPGRSFAAASVDPTEARNSQDLRRRNLHRASSLTVVRSDGHRSRTGRFFLISPMVERLNLPSDSGPDSTVTTDAESQPGRE